MIEIREERPDDIASVREVNQRAFGRAQQAYIVDVLRGNGRVLLSLVATVDDDVVGHILYSRASIASVQGAALAPMAVLPAFQRQGIGSRLIEHGNRAMKDRGEPYVIVLGHAEFYPRFGFRPAATRNIICQWQVPGDAFMVLILDEEKMAGVCGLAKYSEEFSDSHE